MLLVLVPFVIFLLSSYFIRRYLKHFVMKLPASKQKIPLYIIKVVHFLVLGLWAISILNSIGIDLKNFIAGLGLTGFIIGLALKDIFSSIVAGVVIIINDNISIGDILFYKDIKGQVLKIELRYVVLCDNKSKIKHFISTNKLLSEYFSIKKNNTNNS